MERERSKRNRSGEQKRKTASRCIIESGTTKKDIITRGWPNRRMKRVLRNPFIHIQQKVLLAEPSVYRAAFSTLSDVFCHFNPSTRLDLQPQNGNGVASSFANMVCTAARNGYEFVSEFSNGVSRPMTSHVHQVMRKSTAMKPATNNYRIYVDSLLSWKSLAIACFVQGIHPFVAYLVSC